ncbi:uncharacterized protein [Aegilops tauschii subsp. strangulata]|uniref:uncharacterized protein n=1 Tax=Aegilops tauschii subsp. strangulata TaxID=200361 RepID=UPI003CC8DEFA
MVIRLSKRLLRFDWSIGFSRGSCIIYRRIFPDPTAPLTPLTASPSHPNPLSNPNLLPPSDLNPLPPLSLPRPSPTQSAAVLYPDPTPLPRARHEPSAGGSVAGAARASPPRVVSPPFTTAPPTPPSRPPSRAPPDSSLDRDDLDPDPVAATTEALAKVDLSDGPNATATAKSGSSNPRQAARGGGCDVGKSLDYLYRACRIATLTVKHIDVAVSVLSRFMEPKKLASLAEFCDDHAYISEAK